MALISVTYASSPSSDLLISTLEFNNETAGVTRLAQSFNDVTATTELSETVTFIESTVDVYGYKIVIFNESSVQSVTQFNAMVGEMFNVTAFIANTMFTHNSSFLVLAM